ncbi:MAG TPA: MerR family transcriptional regulator [Gammaproteobacteria bacterium]
MAEYTVKQLAELAGVSVRTLHHYDEINLLAPRLRTAAGYRVYGEPELLRLQQILFFRELDVPLTEIGRMLDAVGFDPVAALEDHRAKLEQRLGRLHRLLNTIDRTIERYRGEQAMLSDKELYEGFSDETIERYKREAREVYGEGLVSETERRLKKLTKPEWDIVRKEGEDVTRAVAALMDRSPDSSEVQAAVQRHHVWLNGNFYACSADMYEGLGRMYADNPEFRAYYDQFRDGLADFLSEAMMHYARNTLAHRN